VSKPPAKPVAKVAPKAVAAKKQAPPAPKTSAQPKTAAASKPAPAKKPAPAAKPTPAAKAAPATKSTLMPKTPAPKALPPSKLPAAKAAQPPSTFAAPIYTPPASMPNRFADRFGPGKAPVRPNQEPMDLVKNAAKADPKLVNAWKSKPGRELNEAELLAMPESEYMNEKQIDFFRARLQVQKDDLLSNAGETTEHLREDTSIVPDPADRATIEEEHALELRTRDRERKLLKKISQSLSRLDSGEYGFCDETGEPIGLPRLLARPTATLSLEAQQRRELKQKMFGD